ncbi:hypothetical protein ONZ45_g12248 [Pleurotus djamor]|nr:hypothetical protein ONZ45_g12248 [Pleurotus djamor]
MSSDHLPNSMPERRISEDSNPSQIPSRTPSEAPHALRKALIHCPHDDEPGKLMRRNLIVILDGTPSQSTNVIALFRRIIKIGGDQLIFYNSGVGTYARPSFRSFSYWKQVIYNHIDIAVAWSFKRTVHAAYKWLSENYVPGDRIFLFGFSRGAHQARVIAGMIELVGLLHKGNENQVPFAYALYAATTANLKRESGPHTKSKPPNSAEEHLCCSFKKALCHDKVKVHFVGVWDTVSSIGVFRGRSLPETMSGMGHVCHFRHALALDERRAKFQPEYVNGGLGPIDGETTSDVKEVWFKGTHSDIGGNGMSNKNFGDSLRWMTYEARACGLLMTAYIGNWVPVELRESLTWGWAFLELLPLRALSYEGKDSITWRPHLGRARKIHLGQRIHQSVIGASFQGSEVDNEAVLHKAFGFTGWDALFSGDNLSLDQLSIIEQDPFVNASHALTSLASACLLLELGNIDVYGFNGVLSTLQYFLDDVPETRLASLFEVPDAGGTLLTALGVAVHYQRLTLMTPEPKETLIRLLCQARLVPTTARLPPVSQVHQWGWDICRYREDFLKALQPFAILGHHQSYNYIMDVVFSSLHLQQIVFASSPGSTTSVLLWDGSSQHPNEITNVQGENSVISGDGSHVAVSGSMGVSIINTTTHLPLVIDCADSSDSPLCFTDDNQTLASGHKRGLVKLWQRQGDQWRLSRSFKGDDRGIRYLAFSKDGSRLAFAVDLGPIKVWSLSDQVLVELEDSEETSFSLAWSPSGDWIVSGTIYGSVKIWSSSQGAIQPTFQAHDNTIRCLAFRGDGQVLATGSMDGRVKIWKCDTWANISEFHLADWVTSIAFSPDGKQLVCGGYHGAIRLWDVDTGDNYPTD